MAISQPMVQNVVRLKKGQRIILPSDAKVISVTNVDGAQAESLCPLPPPTPLKSVTFFFDARAEGEGGKYNNYMLFRYFVLGNSKTQLNGPTQDTGLDVPGTAWVQAMKATPGVAALYVCTNCIGSGCSNLITIDYPASLADPYFIMTQNDGGGMDPWFLRVYPLDYSLPGQVDRGTCNNRM